MSRDLPTPQVSRVLVEDRVVYSGSTYNAVLAAQVARETIKALRAEDIDGLSDVEVSIA